MADDLYFIRAVEGPVKIGRSCNVQGRCATLRLMSPVALEVIGVIAEAGDEEAAWHICFADHRLHGEWFRWSDHIDLAIKTALADGDWRTHLRANTSRIVARRKRPPPPTTERVHRKKIVGFMQRRTQRRYEEILGGSRRGQG